MTAVQILFLHSGIETYRDLRRFHQATVFDAASNVSSITYPSGTLVGYTRDSMGKVTSVTAKPPGGSVSNVVTSVTYEPLPEFAATGAPPVTGLSFGNGITGNYGFDAAYRPTTRVDSGTSAVLNLNYGYYANDSVQTITDAVNPANTQNMTYDTLDRLKTATSGTGGYGSYSFTWDPVSNLKTQIINATTTTDSYTAGTNRLSKIVTGRSARNAVSTLRDLSSRRRCR